METGKTTAHSFFRIPSLVQILLRLLLLALVLGILSFHAQRILYTPSFRFSPDSYNYVDIARNILSGKGISQSAAGFNEPVFDPSFPIPMPVTSQPPLYPLLIALFGLFGSPLPQAALVIMLLGMAALLLGSYLLAMEMYGEEAGPLAVAGLLAGNGLFYVTAFAWTETTAVAFSIFALWLLLRARHASLIQPWQMATAGLLTGLAFATRYAFLPLAVLCVLVLIDPRDWKRSIRSLSFYLGGFLLAAAPVILRNYAINGTFLGHARNPSTVGLGENLDRVREWMIGRYMNSPYFWQPVLQFFGLTDVTHGTQITLALAVFAIIGGLAWRRRVLVEALFKNQRFLLPLWGFVYLIFLIIQRSTTHFDPINHRLVFPGMVILVIAGAGLASRALRLNKPVAFALAFLPLLLIFNRSEARLTETTLGPYQSFEAPIANIPVLHWLADHSTDKDLIIGDDVVDVTGILARPAAVSFSPYPYTGTFRYEDLQAVLTQRCSQYERVYLVLHDISRPEEVKAMYGAFIYDLAVGDLGRYPEFSRQIVLDKGAVYEIHCPGD